MCTVTFLPRQAGYALGMNRDEKLTRATACPPARHQLGAREALFPSEPTGGTWVGVNDRGITLALINWYSVRAPVPERALSRGEVVRWALSQDSPLAIKRGMAGLSLDRVSPFRLVGVFPTSRQILEWRWDLRNLECLTHPWRNSTWISSGFDELGAQKIRSQTFRRALRQSSVGQQEWLCRLHRSHLPKPGPYSTCMHREDATTVSFTSVTVSRQRASMRYTPGPPCRTAALQAVDLPLDDGPHPAAVGTAQSAKQRGGGSGARSDASADPFQRLNASHAS